MDAVPCPIAAAGPDSVIRAANAAWHRLARIDGASGSIGRRLNELFPDAAGAPQEVLRAKKAVSRRAIPLACGASGSATWWDLDLVPHPDTPDVVLVTARDATDLVLTRREAEEAREALEPIGARLRLAQEAAGIGTWEWDATADRQSWSPQQFRLHGLDPSAEAPPSFDDWSAMVLPEDRSRIQAMVERGFRGQPGSGFQGEFRIRRADTGAVRWLLSLGRVMEREQDGSLRRILGVNLDVTESRNEREALRESEALLRLASDAAGVYAWDWDIATGRVKWADGLEQALGMPRGGFGGTVDHFRALVHPDDAPGVETALLRAMEGETPGYRATFRMFRADGSIRWTETRGTVLRDALRRPVRVVGMDHDITEQKAAEAQIHAREAQQEAVARLGQFALEEQSAAAVMEQAIQVLTQTLGVELAMVLELLPDGKNLLLRAGRGWSDSYRVNEAIIPAGLQSQAGYTLLLASSRPAIVDDLRLESRFDTAPLLHDHWVVSGMSVIIRGSDQPYGVLGVYTRQPRSFTEHDISCLEAVANIIAAAVQREKAQAALQEREARLRLFIERAPAAIAIFDANMRYMAVSQRFIADFGLSFGAPEDLEGRLHYDIFPNLSQAWCEVHRCVLNGETHRADDEPMVRPDGRTEALRWEMTPWHRADGSVGGALLFTEVITARKQTEAALAESEARFRALSDAMPQMVYVTSATGVSEYKNRRWFEYSGQTPQQAEDDGWMKILHPDDRDATVAAWKHAVATGEPYERELRLRGQDGQYRWFLSRAIPWRASDDGRIIRWFGTETDISDIVHARELAANWAASLETLVADRTRSLTEAAVELQAEMRRRQDTQSALMQSQKLEALGQLTAGVAHDFNNVLSAIQGSFELLERRTADPKLLRTVELGKNATERATALTRQLLDFGRNKSLIPAELNVEWAIHRADEMIGHAVGARISRNLDVQPGVWPVLTDGHQLEVALLNLAINARDAMPKGGKLTLAARNLTPQQRPEALPARDYVCISVQDSGQGMPPEVAARAAEPFFTTKPEGKGTGLGLPMVHAFALRSGGCLRIESRQGVGTTVQIILPRATVTDLDQDNPVQDGLDNAYAGRKATILVVEDDDQVRQVTVGYLRDRGYEVIDAASAEAAIVLSHSIEQLDLLLTDVAMPGAEGPVLAQRLLAERPDMQVLFITGFGDRADLQGQHLLLKPFTGPDLVRAINRRLNRMQTDETADGGLLGRLKNPALVAAYLFWRAARNGGKPPRITDLDWGGLPHADNAFTVAVEPVGNTTQFRYLRVGRALTARLGRSLAGTTMAAQPEPDPGDEILGSLAGAYQRCARTFSPCYEYAKYDLGDGGSPLLFERLMLPASEDGRQITHLIGLALFSGDG